MITIEENLELRREKVEQAVEEMIKIEEEYHASCLRKVSNLSRKILRLIDEEYEIIKKERHRYELSKNNND